MTLYWPLISIFYFIRTAFKQMSLNTIQIVGNTMLLHTRCASLSEFLMLAEAVLIINDDVSLNLYATFCSFSSNRSLIYIYIYAQSYLNCYACCHLPSPSYGADSISPFIFLGHNERRKYIPIYEPRKIKETLKSL